MSPRSMHRASSQRAVHTWRPDVACKVVTAIAAIAARALCPPADCDDSQSDAIVVTDRHGSANTKTPTLLPA